MRCRLGSCVLVLLLLFAAGCKHQDEQPSPLQSPEVAAALRELPKVKNAHVSFSGSSYFEPKLPHKRALVILDVNEDDPLSEGEVQSVRELVAGTVDGLEPIHVKVSNPNGLELPVDAAELRRHELQATRGRELEELARTAVENQGFKPKRLSVNVELNFLEEADGAKEKAAIKRMTAFVQFDAVNEKDREAAAKVIAEVLKLDESRGDELVVDNWSWQQLRE